MAELIAVIHPNGHSSHEAQATLRRLADQHGLQMLDESFAQRMCGALSSGGSLALFVAQDAEAARGSFQHAGAIVVRAALPEPLGLREAALGGPDSDNPQMAGQRRRESGGESTEESGQ